MGPTTAEDGTEDLPSCGCIVGTLRRVAGLRPVPEIEQEHGIGSIKTTPELTLARFALDEQTLPERLALGESKHGEGQQLAITEWSDHYADVEVVTRKGRDGREECRRLEHEDGDRGHVVRVLRYAAERVAEVPK